MEKLVNFLPLSFPWAIALDPCNLCNFGCQYCPNMDRNIIRIRPNGVMPFELFKKIIDDIKDGGSRLKTLKLWKDGEPLLNKDLPHFIYYAKQKDIANQIRLTTNGSLLHTMAEDFIDAQLDWIMISYISSYKQLYKEHAGKGYLRDRVIKNVRILKELRDKKNSDKPHIVVKICKFPFVSDDDIAEFMRQFKDISDETMIHEDAINWPGLFSKDLTLGNKPKSLKRKKVCLYPWYQININFNGEVSVCPVDWSHKTIVGDARKDSIQNIWGGEKMREFRNMFIYQELWRNPICQKCDYYYCHQDNIDNYVLGNAKG